MDILDSEILKELGKFTKKLRKETSKIPKENSSLSEIILFIEDEIKKAGYKPAFPATVCVNEQAAHYTFFDEDYTFKQGDLIKIDFGVYYKGFITDNAFTIEIGDKEEHKEIMETNFKSLNAALETININKTVSDVGKAVEQEASKNNFNTIHNLCGHQMFKDKLHAGLQIPNYENFDKDKIREDMLIAIEPFLTYGAPAIKNGGNSNILHLEKDKPIRDAIAKKILNHIKDNYPLLPFSKRWLLDKFDKRKVLYALKLLKSQGIIHEYEILVSVDGAKISQYEDTVYFEKDKKIILTRLE